MADKIMETFRCPSCFASVEGNANRCDYCGTYFSNKYANVIPYGTASIDRHPFEAELQLGQAFTAEKSGKYYINGGVSNNIPNTRNYQEVNLMEGDSVALEPVEPKQSGLISLLRGVFSA